MRRLELRSIGTCGGQRRRVLVDRTGAAAGALGEPAVLVVLVVSLLGWRSVNVFVAFFLFLLLAISIILLKVSHTNVFEGSCGMNIAHGHVLDGVLERTPEERYVDRLQPEALGQLFE